MLRTFLICQVWAFVLFAPALGMITVPANRYLWCWSYTVLGVRFVAVAVVGLVLFGLGQLLQRLAPRRAAVWIPLAGLTTVGLILWWAFHMSASLSLASLLLQAAMIPILTIGLVQISWRRGWTLAKWQTGLGQAAMFLAPVLPIFWLTALTYPTYPQPPVPTLEQARQVPDRAGSQPTDNVYLFVFDEWPYAYSFGSDGQVLPLMPRLAAASQQMCVFRNAHSPGCHTWISMPRFIFQRTDEVVIRDSQVGFWDGQQFHPSQQLNSLFTTARDQGYRTYLVGWTVPYQSLLGSSVDYVRSLYQDQIGDGPWAQARVFYWDAAIRLFGDSVSQRLIGGHDVLTNYSFTWQNETLLDHSRAILGDARPTGQFVIFHLPAPHYPFCYCATGRRSLDVPYDITSPALQEDQLAYLDQVVGGFLDQIQAAGKAENSTVVLASDHGWRCDPRLQPYYQDDTGVGRFLTHVPLVIRFPGQKNSVSVDGLFSTNHFGRLLEAGRGENFRPDDLPELVRRENLFEPVADAEAYQRKPVVK